MSDGGDTLARRVGELEIMLKAHKQQHAARLAAGDEEAAVGTLATIAKLEVQLENMTTFQRLRALTRQ